MNNFGRAIVFIDNSNIFKNMNAMGQGYRVDWIKLIQYFEDNMNVQIWDQWFFVAEFDEPREVQTKFYNMLHDKGFHVIISTLKNKWVKCPNCDEGHHTKIEKGVDVSIAIHILRLLYNNAFDTAILVSGDSDLRGAIEEVKHNGRKIIVASYRDALSSDIARIANKVIYLDDIANKIELLRE